MSCCDPSKHSNGQTCWPLSTSRSSMLMIIGLLLMIGWFIQPAHSIYCWQCNSATDKFCQDVPAGPMEDPENLHDCYKKMYKECVSDNDKINYTFCRKQVQTIDKDTRIIRSCGFIRSPQDCYWTKNPPATTLVCQCDGDGCNHASKPAPIKQWLTIGLPLVILIVCKLFTNRNQL